MLCLFGLVTCEHKMCVFACVLVCKYTCTCICGMCMQVCGCCECKQMFTCTLYKCTCISWSPSTADEVWYWPTVILHSGWLYLTPKRFLRVLHRVVVRWLYTYRSHVNVYRFLSVHCVHAEHCACLHWLHVNTSSSTYSKSQWWALTRGCGLHPNVWNIVCTLHINVPVVFTHGTSTHPHTLTLSQKV